MLYHPNSYRDLTQEHLNSLPFELRKELTRQYGCVDNILEHIKIHADGDLLYPILLREE